MSPLRKHKLIDNQPFFTLTLKGNTPAPKGVILIINAVEINNFYFI